MISYSRNKLRVVTLPRRSIRCIIYGCRQSAVIFVCSGYVVIGLKEDILLGKIVDVLDDRFFTKLFLENLC